MDIKKINEKIDALSSVCEKGKEEIRDLLSEVIGEPLRKKEEKAIPGQVYRTSINKSFRLVSQEGYITKYGKCFQPDLAIHGGLYSLYANSLKEAVEKAAEYSLKTITCHSPYRRKEIASLITKDLGL